MMPEGSQKGQGRCQGLSAGQWSADPDTGVVSLTEAVLARLVNTDPIDKWYILDPEPIARGQFAVVYHCRHRITGEEFAAKFSSRWRLGSDCTPDIVHEIAVCAMLRPTPRAVQLHDVFNTDSEIVLVMEYAAGGDLQTLLDKDIVPYERDVISFTRQLLEGLVFIHDQSIVHLDIKPQNLVLMGEFPDCAVKLCDFEISRVLTPGRNVRDILGTPDYVAPEIILYEPITTKTDMWSLGVLTYVLLTGFLPFGGETDQETFLEISLGELDFPEELFEDVSAEAIDFIKKLLIRKPHLRMSAKECLEHPWMKADLSKAKIPPQPTRRSSTSSNPLNTSTPIASTTPVSSPPPLRVTTPETPTNLSLLSALSTLTSDSRDQYGRCYGSHSNTPGALTPTNATPTILTPTNTTPTILTPMSSSPRDIGLPPIHPLSGQRSSAVNSTHSSTNSLYRGGSRQSLDRARSLSKSREVLFERMQMSNLKKTLSKSRERLHEGRLGLSRSREDLWAHKSFSHSAEALSVFGWLNQDDSLYKSCNNVFMPMLPMLEENGMSGRLYKSLASIDKIDEVGTESSVCNDRLISDSRFSINDEDYNNLITRYNTAVNRHRNSPPRGRPRDDKIKTTHAEERHRGRQGRDEWREGGGHSLYDDTYHARESRYGRDHEKEWQGKAKRSERRCGKKEAEPQLSQKMTKMSKAERMKRDRHSRRKGKKDKEKNRTENEKKPMEKERTENQVKPTRVPHEQETKNACSSPRAPSPGKRRGSVSHIEQRLQERHERQQERLERQEQKEKLERRGSGKCNTPTPKRRDSAEERRLQNEKNKKNRTTEDKKNVEAAGVPRLRSTSPTKRSRGVKTKSMSSEGTPASSLESVKEVECKRTSTPRNSVSSEPKRSPRGSVSGATSSAAVVRERRSEMDEAYVSLEEPVDDGIFSRSESMDSTITVESDHTVHATDTSSDTLDLTVALPASSNELDQTLCDSPRLPLTPEIAKEPTLEVKETKEVKEDRPTRISNIEASPSESMAELTAIHEEEEDDKIVFTRSVSTSSDIGSMLSESSEMEKDDSSKSQESQPDPALAWQRRGRSMSMQPCDPPPFSHLHLCRSNSFNLVMPLGSFVAAPWGDVCDGAISRALEMFRLNKKDLTTASRTMLERRSSLHSQ